MYFEVKFFEPWFSMMSTQAAARRIPAFDDQSDKGDYGLWGQDHLYLMVLVMPNLMIGGMPHNSSQLR